MLQEKQRYNSAFIKMTVLSDLPLSELCLGHCSPKRCQSRQEQINFRYIKAHTRSHLEKHHSTCTRHSPIPSSALSYHHTPPPPSLFTTPWTQTHHVPTSLHNQQPSITSRSKKSRGFLGPNDHVITVQCHRHPTMNPPSLSCDRGGTRRTSDSAASNSAVRLALHCSALRSFLLIQNPTANC
jgi:hypothetical protein